MNEDIILVGKPSNIDCREICSYSAVHRCLFCRQCVLEFCQKNNLPPSIDASQDIYLLPTMQSCFRGMVLLKMCRIIDLYTHQVRGVIDK